MMNDIERAQVLLRSCTKCHASKGDPCTYPTNAGRKPRKSFHMERVSAAGVRRSYWGEKKRVGTTEVIKYACPTCGASSLEACSYDPPKPGRSHAARHEAAFDALGYALEEAAQPR